MDLKQLEYFVRVAELGSFTRASVALNIAQPALSRQVRQLEVELRQTLLRRNGRGINPTEAGSLLLEHARGILHQVARAREDLGRLRGSLAGRVALGLPPSIGKIMTVPLSRAFRRRLPQATLSIGEGLTIQMQEGLLTGRLDIALLYNPAPSPDLEVIPLQTEELFLVAPATDATLPDRALSLREVAGRALILPSRPNALRMLIEGQMAGIGCRPTLALEIDGIPAILDLVADGAGYAVLPRYSVAHAGQPASFRVQAIVQPGLVSHLVIATAANRPRTHTQTATLELLQQVAAQVFGAPT